jgi:hypothetical protein
VLINHDRCTRLGVFLLIAMYFVYLIIALAYHIIPALADYQP